MGKARAACAQSFALWQQATIGNMRRNHSIIACSPHIYVVFFFAHIPFVVNHTFNARPMERLQQHPLIFATNRIDRTFCVKVSHSTTFTSWSQRHFVAIGKTEQQVGKASLHTVAASNRVHPTRSLSSLPSGSTVNCSPGSQALLEVTHQDHSIGITLLLLVPATYIWVLFFAHIPFAVNRTFNATERPWQHPLFFTTNFCFLLRSEKPERHVPKASHCDSKQQ